MEMVKQPNPNHRRSIDFFGCRFYWDGGRDDLLWQIMIFFFYFKIRFAVGYGCLWWLVVGVCGSGWWVAAILWLFVVIVKVGMWWLLR